MKNQDHSTTRSERAQADGQRRKATITERLAARPAHELLGSYYFKLVRHLASHAQAHNYDYERGDDGFRSTDDRHFSAALRAIEDAYAEGRAAEPHKTLWHFLKQRARRHMKGKVRFPEVSMDTLAGARSQTSDSAGGDDDDSFDRLTATACAWPSSKNRPRWQRELAEDIIAEACRGNILVIHYLLDYLPKDAAKMAVRAMNAAGAEVSYAPSQRSLQRAFRKRQRAAIDDTIVELQRLLAAARWEAAVLAAEDENTA